MGASKLRTSKIVTKAPAVNCSLRDLLLRPTASIGLTGDLAAIADWRDDFAARVRRAQPRFEFVGLDPAEQERLEAEAEVFEAVCRAMSASFARPEAERRAA